MLSNEQSGAFSCTLRGGQARRRRTRRRGVISIATVKSPAVMFGLR